MMCFYRKWQNILTVKENTCMKKTRKLLSIVLVIVWGGIGIFRFINHDIKPGIMYCIIALLFLIPLFLSKKADSE